MLQDSGQFTEACCLITRVTMLRIKKNLEKGQTFAILCLESFTQLCAPSSVYVELNWIQYTYCR